jgi:hypothetical protein
VPGNQLANVGRAPNRCGTDLGEYAPIIAGICLELNQPGTPDDSCPEVASTTRGQARSPGCCTDLGFCGAYEQFLPLGCHYPRPARVNPAARDGGADGAGKDGGTDSG